MKLLDEWAFLEELRSLTKENQVVFSGGDAIKALVARHTKELPNEVEEIILKLKEDLK
jgi:hypothetical protein